MITTIFGIKNHMTQTFDQNGKRLPVTVIKTTPLTVTQVKTVDADGYKAVQVGFGTKNKHPKSLAGHLKKSETKARFLREIPIDTDEIKVGDTLTVSQVLKPGDVVVVRGVSKGRGFSGAMKRWGFHGGPKTHGQSDRARAVGSIGQGTDPGRVHKGKKMPGRYGNQQHAIRSLQVLKIDETNQEVWISGPIPGSFGSIVWLTVSGEASFAGLYQPPSKQSIPAKPNVNQDQSIANKTDNQTDTQETELAKTDLTDSPSSEDKLDTTPASDSKVSESSTQETV